MAIEGGRQKIEAMLQQQPKDPELQYMLAMEYVSEANDKQAVSVFKEIMDAAGISPVLSLKCARALQRLGEFNEAQRDTFAGHPRGPARRRRSRCHGNDGVFARSVSVTFAVRRGDGHSRPRPRGVLFRRGRLGGNPAQRIGLDSSPRSGNGRESISPSMPSSSNLCRWRATVCAARSCCGSGIATGG